MKITLLNRLSIVLISGDDAVAFLQGQLTNDVTLASDQKVQMTAHCSPKGRVLANFMLFKYEENFCLIFPKNQIDSILKRLQMFILRAKVKMTCVDARFVLLGVSQIEKNQWDDKMVSIDDDKALMIESRDHWEEIEKTEKNSFSYGNDWDNLMIKAGYPFILPKTQDLFVPQMINLDVLDGINFKKGCYTGQEIVARTKYLGKLKRRMYLLSYCLKDYPITDFKTMQSPKAGDALYTDDMGDQVSGTIVNVALDDSGEYLLALAVLQISSVETKQPIHWLQLDGHLLKVEKEFANAEHQ